MYFFFRKNAWRLFCIVLFPFPFFANVGTFETPWLCVSAPLILALLLRKLSGHPLMLKKSTDFNKLSALLFITAGLILVSSYVFQKVCSVVGIPALCLLLMCYHFVDSGAVATDFMVFLADFTGTATVLAGNYSRQNRMVYL